MAIMEGLGGYNGVYPSPIGWLGYQVKADKLILLRWLGANALRLSDSRSHQRIDFVHERLEQYFRNAKSLGNTPFNFIYGTLFQQRVWSAIHQIPFGEVTSYSALARRLKTANQAVGQACRKNHIALLIPCHRVVAADGIGGYIGHKNKDSLIIKRWLLKHEGRKDF